MDRERREWLLEWARWWRACAGIWLRRALRQPWVRVGLVGGLYVVSFVEFDDFLRVHHGPDWCAAIGTWLLCVGWLPYLVWARRQLAGKGFPPSAGWSRAAAILLWVSLVMGLLILGLMGTFAVLTGPMERTYHWSAGLLVIVIVVYGAGIGGGIGLIGFFIQLWRNQWRPKLMTVCFGVYLLPLLYWLVRS